MHPVVQAQLEVITDLFSPCSSHLFHSLALFTLFPKWHFPLPYLAGKEILFNDTLV